MASYSASKFALRAFADSLRAEEPALRVTSVHPGRIATAMQRQLVEFEGGKYDPKHFLRPETVGPRDRRTSSPRRRTAMCTRS